MKAATEREKERGRGREGEREREREGGREREREKGEIHTATSSSAAVMRSSDRVGSSLPGEYVRAAVAHFTTTVAGITLVHHVAVLQRRASHDSMAAGDVTTAC
jgi:hypothetical protein